MTMKMRKVPFSPPDMSEAEAKLAAEAIMSGWITTGPKTKEFESKISSYLHTEKTVCLNSATAAMELALRLIGVGPDDEVIVPAYTYTATASVTQHVGCRLVMVDCNEHNQQMDLQKLSEAITERTKVISPVDLGGVVCEYDKILEIIEQLDLFAVCLEVGPYIPVNRNDDFALQVFSHAENIRGGHLVLHADRVFAEGAERDVDVVILAVLCEINGEMRVAGVVDVAARCLQQIVDCLFIHIRRAFACQLFAVRSRGIRRHDAGAVKAVETDNLDVLDFDDVARLDGDAAVFGDAPLHPCLYGLGRSDERNGDLFAVFICGCHAALDDVSRPFRGHMILVIVCRENRVHLLECKRINDEGNVAEIRLHESAAAHVCHLVADLHLAVAVCALSVAAPQVDGDVGAAGSLEPDACASEPPHSHIARLNDLVFDVLDKPGAPFGEGAHDPAFSGHF